MDDFDLPVFLEELKSVDAEKKSKFVSALLSYCQYAVALSKYRVLVEGVKGSKFTVEGDAARGEAWKRKFRELRTDINNKLQESLGYAWMAYRIVSRKMDKKKHYGLDLNPNQISFS